MKKLTIFITFAFVSMLFFTACNEDEFLDTQPKGTLSGDQLESPEGVEALINAAYAGLAMNFADPNPAFFQPPSNWSYGDMRSDDAYKGGGGVGDIAEYHDLEIGNVRADNPLLERKWQAMYVAIGRVNKALKALREIDPADYEDRNARIGEMRFLRGHFYFDMMINFGTFAYIHEGVANNELEEISNSFDEEELWGYIETDFAAARDTLPEVASKAGRVNKFAAHAYLSKTYIFQEKWDQALTEANAVINSGQYALFTDIRNLWKVDAEHGPEFIFSIEHSINDGSDFGNINWGNLLNAPRGPAYGGDGFHRPSQNLVNAYKVDENGLPMFDSFNEENVDEDTPIDPRLDHFIGRIGIPWKSFEESVYDESWCRNLQEYGPYAAKKYQIDPNSSYMIEGWPWGGSPLNWPILKYSDVLLWKAEALIKLNQNLDEARNLINDIRERAQNAPRVQKLDGSGPAANYKIEPYPASGWDQETALKALRMERRLELCLEGHRFYDLARWGIAEDVLNTYFAEETEERSYYGQANFIGDKHEHLPVPQNEIDRSGGLYQQNPAY
ncbi:MAG: RagB/SusD family nutrient uptake outer membrane protein [Bacteroidales bacterium]|nr:RagB/SusD family nutrient uptake outer membrane protein [Bacteroidales bacterium]